MNYLAHLFLSGADPLLQLGNFIADGVRKTQLAQFPERVQQGIYMHHLIDRFTDTHPVVHQSKERLRPTYRKYASVIADIYYDHFLARNFSHYSHQPLPEFAASAYANIQAQPALLPARVQRFLPYMVEHNWLVSYAQVAGISQALRGLSRRASFESGMETAGEELCLNYEAYHQEFNQFFPELQQYVAKEIIIIGN
ncbi:ACP phosphodiesterase [Rufibacter sp. LB8]|uniref:acyl carrier protein phosphodiesterase n=1 Tax=Rufibacter sp. LB8 TaxID=2777781 RepID=UPI00178C7CBE|nr:ACP phosphodiesterase [Rufibacter sp. LB8]